MSQQLGQYIQTATPCDGLDVYTYKTGSDVVTISGSILGGEDYSPRDNPMLADITIGMLDEGTTKHSKAVIREKLDTIGASIEFSTCGSRVHFDAKCLRNDVGTVLALIAEQLRHPAFNKKEYESVQRRMSAIQLSDHESSRKRVNKKLAQSLYPSSHPNYAISAHKAADHISKTTINDVKAFHADVYGLGDAVIAIVGDIDHKNVIDESKKAFNGWKKTKYVDHTFATPHKKQQAKEDIITMKDNAGVDVLVGSTLGITHTHPDFYALHVGLSILGGKGFDARLMREIRENRGLTYGVYASIKGVQNRTDGYWCVWASFAPQLLRDGLYVLRSEIQKIVSSGVSEDEVTTKKKSLVGSYKVSLSNTEGIANTIRTNAEEQYPPVEIDDVIHKIQEVTTEDVNRTLQKYIHPSILSTIIAGPVDKSNNPLQ